jgi:cytochrome b subunit of formate dehydrogenase
VGLLFTLSLHYFHGLEVKTEKDSAGFSLKAYFSWLFKSIPGFFKTSWSKRCRDCWKKWIVHPYPKNVRWIFICLFCSFFYLAASGFLFALLFPRRLYGFPLMLHVCAGGVFAVSLALALVLRARSYVFSPEEEKIEKNSSSTRSRICFWLFIGAGLLLIVTALVMMLPLFSLKVQIDLFEVHRYSALIAVLVAVTFVYFAPNSKGR